MAVSPAPPPLIWERLVTAWTLIPGAPVVTIALITPLFGLYLTPLYEVGLRSTVVGATIDAGLVAAGFRYFWTRFRTDPHRRAGVPG